MDEANVPTPWSGTISADFTRSDRVPGLARAETERTETIMEQAKGHPEGLEERTCGGRRSRCFGPAP